jgi:hypothetical protein
MEEFGDFVTIEQNNDRAIFCRFFNKVEVEDATVCETVVDPALTDLHEKEKAWYREASDLGFRHTPEMHGFDPLVMERLNGHHLFQIKDLSRRKQRTVLADYLDSLTDLHDRVRVPTRREDVKEVYIDKTLMRIESVINTCSRKMDLGFIPYPFSSSASSTSMVSFVQVTKRRQRYLKCFQAISIRLRSRLSHRGLPSVVWPQIEEERLVVKESALLRSVIDARVIEHDHGGFAVALLDQCFDEPDDMACRDGARVRGMDQRILAEVERADDREPAVAVALSGMGQAAW